MGGRVERNTQLCVLKMRFKPALDRSGTPIVATTPVNVHFDRPPPVNEAPRAH
jgi:hypothetical protein